MKLPSGKISLSTVHKSSGRGICESAFNMSAVKMNRMNHFRSEGWPLNRGSNFLRTSGYSWMTSEKAQKQNGLSVGQSYIFLLREMERTAQDICESNSCDPHNTISDFPLFDAEILNGILNTTKAVIRIQNDPTILSADWGEKLRYLRYATEQLCGKTIATTTKFEAPYTRGHLLEK